MLLKYWIIRFLVVFAGTFIVLFLVSLARGRGWQQAGTESAIWAGIATAIFIATRVYRLRKGQHCELCGDPPSLRAGKIDASTKDAGVR